MTLETTLREAFEDLTSDPPTFQAPADQIVSMGRQARRRRQLRLAAASVPVIAGLSVVGVVAAAATLAGGHQSGTGRSTIRFASGNGHAAGFTPSGTAADQAMEKAAVAASPAGFSFDIRGLSQPVEDEFGFDGTANDGQGAGRLYVVFDPKPDMLQLTPCTDPDFVAGGSCTSTVLPDGNTLVLRGENGTTYTQVLAVVIHPDGTGTTAESDNGTFPEFKGRLTTKRLLKDKRSGRGMEHVTRADPTYTVEQLGQIAVAADQAASSAS